MRDVTLTRRRILAGAAALGAPVAANSALAAVSAGSHPDAALLALGERFDGLRLELEAMRPEYDAARAAIAANVEAWRERLDVAVREGRDNGVEVWERTFREADPDDVNGRHHDFLEKRLDLVTMAILRATVAGLAVKARALMVTTVQEIWSATDPREELDLDQEHIRDLVDSLLRLAGVDRFGRPLAEEGAGAFTGS